MEFKIHSLGSRLLRLHSSASCLTQFLTQFMKKEETFSKMALIKVGLGLSLAYLKCT